jgi:ABC-2 type transport system permease protein
LSKFPVLQYAVLVNPLVYASEGLRGTLTQSDHINTTVVIAALAAINVALLVVGLKKFHGKAVS